MHRRGALFGLILLISLPLAVAAQEREPDDFELLQELRNQFREGNYEAVERLAREIFETEPSMLVRAETHQYLGAAYEMLGRSEEAEEQFEELLTLQPQFMMDQAEFPTEVITLFETVRLRVQDRLRQIEERRRRAQEQERRERERRLREEQDRLFELSRTRYLVREAHRRHWVVTLMPFGAGQFQNGRTTQGYVFLGLELGLLVASIPIWIVGSTLSPEVDREQGARLRDGLMYASWALGGAGLVVYLSGVIEALVHYFRDPPEAWREVDEEDVPEEYRLDAGDAPEVGPTPRTAAEPAP